MKKPTRQKATTTTPAAETPARSPAQRAAVSLDAASNAALVIDAYGQKVYGEQPLGVLADTLYRNLRSAGAQGTQSAEAMLTAQAHALQTMFVHLARRAAHQEQPAHIEVFTRLALKAQSQCRASLETLALIKNPPSVSIVRQANIGQAVQVNNGQPLPAQPAGPTITSGAATAHPALPGEGHVERLDPAAAEATGRAHPALAPVEAINGPQDSDRQGAVVEEPLQGRPARPDARPGDSHP